MTTQNFKKDIVKEDILKILKKASRPLSTQDIASELDKPWHSVHTRCLILQIEKHVKGFRIGRMNLWELDN